jgi:hypothetical protein
MILRMDEQREHREDNRVYTDDELWGETGKPVLREPDFSDVRKHLFKPWKIIVFAVLAGIFWAIYFYFTDK